MANTTTATISSTTNNNVVVLTPAVQRSVKQLREGRNLTKQAKEMSDTARIAILDFLGQITTNTIGADAKGKRLISVKVIDSPERFDWDTFAKEQPELHETLTQRYTIPRGAGEPQLRVDVI